MVDNLNDIPFEFPRKTVLNLYNTIISHYIHHYCWLNPVRSPSLMVKNFKKKNFLKRSPPGHCCSLQLRSPLTSPTQEAMTNRSRRAKGLPPRQPRLELLVKMSAMGTLGENSRNCHTYIMIIMDHHCIFRGFSWFSHGCLVSKDQNASI